MSEKYIGVVAWAKERIGQIVGTKGGWELRIIAVNEKLNLVTLRIPGSITKIVWDNCGEAINAYPTFNMA